MLLSWSAASFAQTAIPVQFSSEDGIDTHWYYIGFDRKQSTNLVWTVDLTVSGEVQQKAKANDDYTQQWKLVGDETGFYFVNRSSGYKMAYTGVPITDSNGNQVPIVSGDGSVYYVDQAVATADAAKCNFLWQSATGGAGKNGWSIINPSLGAGTPYMNDRAGRNVCNYGYTDPGCLIDFFDADKLTIVTTVDSLYRDGLVNNSSPMTLQVSSINISGSITGTITDDDEGVFGFNNGVNTIPNGEGALYLTFTPKEAKDYTATLTLSFSGADDVTVALKGTGFTESDLPFIISSDDNSNEHWYYVQFTRKAASNLVWAFTDSARYDNCTMIVQDTLKGGVIRADQQWKICGDWDMGYYIVNRETRQEILYNTKDLAGDDGDRRIFTDVPPDGTNGADRYVAGAAFTGNYFEFTRFNKGVTWQMVNRTTPYYNIPNRNFMNDYQGRFLCNYTINDVGNELVFISADAGSIVTASSSLSTASPVGETVNSDLSVIGMSLTADITATITDDAASVFSVTPATLPAEGGTLTIAFAPTAVQSNQTATLTLTSGSAQKVITLIGNSDIGLPLFSSADDSSEHWYYMQFNRKATGGTANQNAVIQGNGMDQVLSQADTLATGQIDNYAQQWKFVGTYADGFYIINRAGGQMSFSPDDGFYILADAGDLHIFDGYNSTYQWQILNTEKDNDPDGGANIINDYGGLSQRQVGMYYVNDVGNYLRFISIDGVSNTAIQNPAIDSNDTVISATYYTLEGVQVKQPTGTGIYIVKKLYASGKTQATKILFQHK